MSAMASQIEQPRMTTLPRRQTSAIRQIEIVSVVLGQLLTVGVLEDVEAFGISLHQAVLDPVVHHLHEVAGAEGPQ